MQSALLGPVIGLVLWSFVMWGWMYATRIPFLVKNKLIYDPHRPAADFLAQIPATIRWKADNYNHLMEQPTLFYAVALTLAVVGDDNAVNVALAWLYVGTRVVHSLVQAIVNAIIVRFWIFVMSSLVLLALTIRAALAVF
jgi:hypothetical protein